MSQHAKRCFFSFGVLLHVWFGVVGCVVLVYVCAFCMCLMVLWLSSCVFGRVAHVLKMPVSNMFCLFGGFCSSVSVWKV